MESDTEESDIFEERDQKFPRQLLRKMQQFILEEQLEVICDEDGREYKEVVELEKEEFIQVILRLHKANSSPKRRSMVTMLKWGNRTYLSTLTFNMLKMFVSLKPEIFREEIYSRTFDTLVDVMTETRHELANYRDSMEISERIKRPEPRKDSKDGSADGLYPGSKGAIARLLLGRLS